MIEVPVSLGELVDKLTILRIKQQHISAADKAQNILYEHSMLMAKYEQLKIPERYRDTVSSLTGSLQAVNEIIWAVEDEIRSREAQKDFGARFVELARSVYFNNDERARIKREINNLLGSQIIEEKSYQAY